MSKTKVVCPECSRKYSIDESHLGRKARCKKCNAKFVLRRTEEMSSSKRDAAGASEPQVSASTSEDHVPAEWNEGDVILDRYEVRGVLGQGGMGLVYDVWHREWNKRLAVKSPRPDYFKTEAQKENFTREAETWINLGLHPHAVSCFYVRTLGGIPRVFAECIEGGDLKEWIDSKKLYEGGPDEALKRILDIAIQFAWGLGFAHENNLIHQDVKPANVMMTPGGVAKVTDFGLAKARGEAGEDASRSDGRSVLASYGGMTPAYCSPEQANKETLTRRTDIWSWALSVLEMFIGEVTWTSGVAAPSVLEAYLEDGTELEAPPPMPKALAELLASCFEFREEDRPHDMREVAEALKEIYAEVSGLEYKCEEPRGIDLSAGALNNHAISMIDLDRLDDSLRFFNEALGQDPAHLDALFNRDHLMTKRGWITDEDMLAHANALALEHADSSEYWQRLGILHSTRGSTGEAHAAFKRCTELGGTAPQLADTSPVEIHGLPPLNTGGKLEGHSIAVFPDKPLLLCGCDGAVVIFDRESGAVVSRRQAGDVKAISVSPDGSFFATSGWNEPAHIWDASRFDPLVQLEDSVGVTETAFSSDYCIGACQDKHVRLWDLRTGELLHVLEGHGRFVSGVAILPNGQNALSCSSHVGLWLAAKFEDRGDLDEQILLWDLRAGRPLRFYDAGSPVAKVAVFDDGKRFLSAGLDGRLCVWNIETDEVERQLVGHRGGVTACALVPGNRYAVSGGEDKTVRIWDLSAGSCIHTLSDLPVPLPVQRVCVSSDGGFCAAGLFGGPLVLRLRLVLPSAQPLATSAPSYYVSRPVSAERAMRRQRQARTLEKEAQEALACGNAAQAYNTLCKMTERSDLRRSFRVAAIRGDCVRRGRIVNVRSAWAREYVLESGISSAQLLDDSRKALIACGHDVVLYDLEHGRVLCVMREHQATVNEVALVPGTSWCVSASSDKTLMLWDFQQATRVRTMVGHDAAVCSVRVLPDGKRCVSVGPSGDNHKGPLLVWSLESGRLQHTLERDYTSEMWCFLDVSPDGRWCVVGSYYSRDLINLDQLTSIGYADGWRGEVGREAILPDGERYLTANRLSPSLCVDRLGSSQTVKLADFFPEYILALAVSSDSRLCAVGSDRGIIRILSLSSGEVVRELRAHTDEITSLAWSTDGTLLLSGGRDRRLILWTIDCEIEFPAPAEWHEGARPHLETFLTLCCPPSPHSVGRIGKPKWNDEDLEYLVADLGRRGYGWLRPEGVRKELEKMAAAWQGPPPLPGVTP